MKKSNVDGLAGILKGLSGPPQIVDVGVTEGGRGEIYQPKAPKFEKQMMGTKRVSQEEKAVANAKLEAIQDFKEERRGPGRPPGKRSDPNFDRMTVLVRKDTLDELDMMLLKEKNGPQDRSELVEILLRNHLQARTANKLG